MNQPTATQDTFRLTFDIVAHGADPSDLLDRLIEFQQELLGELEEEEDTYGVLMSNEADEDTCSVKSI